MGSKNIMGFFEQQLIDSIDSGNFLEVASCIYTDNYDNKEKIGQAVADLHNASSVDVIAEFMKLNRSDQKQDFFMTRHVLEHALPRINAPVAAVMDCVKHLVEQAGNDMAAGTLIPPFIKFCEVNAERVAEVLSAALADIDDTFDFITPAITAGSHLQLEQYASNAVELCLHENIKIRSRSVHALGRIIYHDRKELIAKSLQAIKKAVEQDRDEYLYISALRSVIALYNADNSREEFVVNLMKHILHEPTDNVLNEASWLFSFKAEKMPVNMVDLLLEALVRINSEHHGTIKNVDFGLCSLIEHRMREKVICFLETLLIQREKGFSVRQFETLISALRNNKDRSLDILVTRWLLSKQIVLGRAAAELLDDHSNYGVVVTADLDQLPEGSRIFLARKACGWFFHKPISAVSIIVSLMDSASDDEVQEMAKILFHPLLISYSCCAKEHLAKIVNDYSEKLKQVINILFDRLDSYYDGSNSSIREMLPIQAQRETYSRHLNRSMNDSVGDRPQGILAQIFKPTFLLYGNRSIHYIYHGTGDQKSRQEMPLAKISHSFELPSLECIDPHSLDYTLCVFRIEGCNS